MPDTRFKIPRSKLSANPFVRSMNEDVQDVRLFGTAEQRAATPIWPGAANIPQPIRPAIRLAADPLLARTVKYGAAQGMAQSPQTDGMAVKKWLSCIGDNAICDRKKRYQEAAKDPQLSARTTFPKAAATVLDYLDSPRFMTGFSKDTADWYDGVSSRLEPANHAVFADLRAGKAIPGITDAPDGVDRAMVRFEQGRVQRELDALKRADPGLYAQVVKQSNETFKSWWDANPAIGMTRRKLGGRVPDFAREADQRQIGYETVRNEAARSCIQGGVCDARTLNGR